MNGSIDCFWIKKRTRFHFIEGSASTERSEFRVWNAYRSKLGAAIVNGIKDIYIKPGAKVLYLGAASGTTVSHVADIVGPVTF